MERSSSGFGRLLICYIALSAVVLLVDLRLAEAQILSPVPAPAPAPGPATTTGYYISYGALSADRVVCPPQSGRSYYTANCESASGPVRPYQRTCSTITQCARDEI